MSSKNYGPLSLKLSMIFGHPYRSYMNRKTVKLAREAIQNIKEELGKKPEESLEIIKFLNSKNRQELEEIGINDRTETILAVRKVISKKNLMIQLEDKFQNMEISITRFMIKFDVLRQKGLPNPLVINDRLMK